MPPHPPNVHVLEPVHETLDKAFRRYVGHMLSEHLLDQIEADLNGVLRQRACLLPWTSAGLPFRAVVIQGAYPGEVGWAFKATEQKHILWVTPFYQEEIERHFPAGLFIGGRPG